MKQDESEHPSARFAPPQSAPGIPKYHDPDDPHDIRNILKPEQIALLRTGYDQDVMNHAATMALVRPYPPARAISEFIVDHFYKSKRWLPDLREQCVITYFASRSAGNEANLGVHIYWGLMVGLTPDVIADTILLAAAYSGIENYSNGIGVLMRVLQTLKSLVEGPDPRTALRCMNVVSRLRP